MRALVAGFLVLFSLSFASLAVVTATLAQEGCSCKGCGCKGGPGWRGPEGTCVSQTKLASICGSPAGAPCVHEAAVQVCFARPFGEPARDTQTQTQ
ncbi:MAG: hypothetical protein ACRECX_06960 [Methyloceanibacter sp.]|uniref:hypothetical protein n=1 Tax=Methyloceanibacter sp. TaxID=1965321 RepID=UPI003D6CF4E1